MQMIDLNQAEVIESELLRESGILGKLRERTEDVAQKLPYVMENKLFCGRLRRQAEEIMREQEIYRQMCRALQNVRAAYIRTENRIESHVEEVQAQKGGTERLQIYEMPSWIWDILG